MFRLMAHLDGVTQGVSGMADGRCEHWGTAKKFVWTRGAYILGLVTSHIPCSRSFSFYSHSILGRN